eukprot:7298831-Lingulodinium_polyedra.AAC.1
MGKGESPEKKKFLNSVRWRVVQAIGAPRGSPPNEAVVRCLARGVANIIVQRDPALVQLLAEDRTMEVPELEAEVLRK